MIGPKKNLDEKTTIGNIKDKLPSGNVSHRCGDLRVNSLDCFSTSLISSDDRKTKYKISIQYFVGKTT